MGHTATLQHTPMGDDVGWTVSLRGVLKTLIIGLVIVGVGHAAAMFIRFGLGYDMARGLVPLFHLDNEANVPTLYSVALMLVISTLAVLIMRLPKASQGGRFQWRLLAVAFLFLAADEIFSLHEILSSILSSTFELSGVFHYAWIIPYSALAVVFAIVMMPWFFRLNLYTQILCLIAGTLYVGGAIGMEVVAGLYQTSLIEQDAVGRTLNADLLSTVEETMEILGLSVFLYALAQKLAGGTGKIHLAVQVEDPDT